MVKNNYVTDEMAYYDNNHKLSVSHNRELDFTYIEVLEYRYNVIKHKVFNTCAAFKKTRGAIQRVCTVFAEMF